MYVCMQWMYIEVSVMMLGSPPHAPDSTEALGEIQLLTRLCWSRRTTHQKMRQTWCRRNIPAFSSSRFLAASALCCLIKAKRSARVIYWNNITITNKDESQILEKRMVNKNKRLFSLFVPADKKWWQKPCSKVLIIAASYWAKNPKAEMVGKPVTGEKEL